MVKGLYTAYTGMLNQQNRMDVLTNNLANSATVGFKKEGATTQAFDDVLAYHIKDQSNPTNVRHIGSLSLGAKVGENYTDFTQGHSRRRKIRLILHFPEMVFLRVNIPTKPE